MEAAPHTFLPPLVVDLDETLVRTDTLLESAVLFLRRDPLLFALPFVWLLKGKAQLKRELGRRVTLEVDALPYHQELLAFLRAEKARGRFLLLATASDETVAHRVAEHLGLFDAVLASDGVTNLRGARKLAAIRSTVPGAFAYAANDHCDLPIWENAAEAIVVNARPAVLRRVRRAVANVRVFDDVSGSRFQVLLSAMRIHQWVKNLLLFVPLAMAHRIGELPLLMRTGLAFLAFSLVASSVYLFNDILDLDADRRHPRKRSRALASGRLPIATGFLAGVVLMLSGLALGAVLSVPLLAALLAYLAMTLAYSFDIKQRVLVDALWLAGLYTLRIFAGSLVAGVPVSQWLLSFSLFIFMSLALVKRYSELHEMRSLNRDTAKGRGYETGDLVQLLSLGTTCGCMAVLVLALYINSREVVALYRNPEALWLICPLLLYWINRVWLLAHRGFMHEDPIVFAIRDKRTYLVGLLAVAILLWAA